MKTRIVTMIFLACCSMQVSAQTLLAEETFAGGAADWVDFDRNPVTYNASGGQDGGAYISVTENIDTTSGGQFGGYLQFRCAVAPSQLPSQNCSGGIFVDDWYFGTGVKELRYWFRHNSTKPGGIQPTIRVAVTGNQIGGSAIFPAIPANTWTELVVPIDPQSPLWDENWGSLNPDAVRVFTDVGRLQPGIYVDPNDPVYTEANVTFDIDDVSISGWGSVTPVVLDVRPVEGALHPHHDGSENSPDMILDDVPIIVYGSQVTAGDPVDFDPTTVRPVSIRIGQLGGPRTVAPVYNFDDDGDGINDGRYQTTTDLLGGACDPSWKQPTEVAFRAELFSGEVVGGVDDTIIVDCDAQCHN